MMTLSIAEALVMLGDMSSPIGAAFVIVLGLLLLLFPGFFISLGDIKAAIRGYQPIEGHPFRSRGWVRFVGVMITVAGGFMLWAATIS